MTSVTDNTSGISRTLQSQYLADGSRWELKHADNQAFRYYYWPGGQFNHMTAPQGDLLVDYNYTHRGELEEIVRDSTAPKQQWTYDPIGRMDSNFIDAPTTVFDVTWGYTRNPASQIRTETQTNDSFSWDGYVPVDRSYATNGLNQYTSVSGQAYCYDDNGNLTADGDFVYLYDVENRLVEMRAPANTDCENLAYTGQIKAELRYDPMGRLFQVENFISGVGQGRVTMLYDGDALVAEYNASGTMLARYVHGPMQGVDDPIAEYGGSGVAAANRINLYTDSRGSIVLRAGATGGTPSINTYDEYGQPSTSNVGRFQYTGQVWLPELGMYYYKARIYSPALGRFMQTDPIGYEDNVNLYGYVGQDPVNFVDETGSNRKAVLQQLGRWGLRGLRGERVIRRSDLDDIARSVILPLQIIDDLNTIGDIILNDDADDVPDGIVGEQDDPRAGPNRSGSRWTSGPLSEANGGVGDPKEDFDTLTGGKHSAPPEGSTLPEGSRVGDNGVIYRPGNSDGGISIDIPRSGDKPRETLHYPPEEAD